jgi:hypothetical protein
VIPFGSEHHEAEKERYGRNDVSRTIRESPEARDIEALLRKLESYRIELEEQNEGFRRSEAKRDYARSRYALLCIIAAKGPAARQRDAPRRFERGRPVDRQECK